MKPKININTLAVNDLERSIAFYKEGLGLPTEGLEEGADHIIFDMEDGISLVLFLRSELEELYDWGYSGHFKDLDGHIWEIVSFN